jgi:hypothetical protein
VRAPGDRLPRKCCPVGPRDCKRDRLPRVSDRRRRVRTRKPAGSVTRPQSRDAHLPRVTDPPRRDSCARKSLLRQRAWRALRPTSPLRRRDDRRAHGRHDQNRGGNCVIAGLAQRRCVFRFHRRLLCCTRDQWRLALDYRCRRSDSDGTVSGRRRDMGLWGLNGRRVCAEWEHRRDPMARRDLAGHVLVGGHCDSSLRRDAGWNPVEL